MKLTEVMKRLEQAGDEQTLKTWRRHEVTGPAFGVRFAEMPLTPQRIVAALRAAGAYEKLSAA